MAISDIKDFIVNHIEKIIRIASIILFFIFITVSLIISQVGFRWFNVWLFGIVVIILALFSSILVIFGIKQMGNAYKILGALSIWVLMHLMVRFCDPITFSRAAELVSLWMFEYLLVLGIVFLSSCFANPNVVFIRIIYGMAIVLAFLIFTSHFVKPISVKRAQVIRYIDEAWKEDMFRRIKINEERYYDEKNLGDVRSLANKKGLLTPAEKELIKEKEEKHCPKPDPNSKEEKLTAKELVAGTVLTEVVKQIPANKEIDTGIIVMQDQIDQGISCLLTQEGEIQTYWYLSGVGSDIKISVREYLVNLHSWGKIELKGGKNPTTVRIQIIYTGKKS